MQRFSYLARNLLPILKAIRSLIWTGRGPCSISKSQPRHSRAGDEQDMLTPTLPAAARRLTAAVAVAVVLLLSLLYGSGAIQPVFAQDVRLTTEAASGGLGNSPFQKVTPLQGPTAFWTSTGFDNRAPYHDATLHRDATLHYDAHNLRLWPGFRQLCRVSQRDAAHPARRGHGRDDGSIPYLLGAGRKEHRHVYLDEPGYRHSRQREPGNGHAGDPPGHAAPVPPRRPGDVGVAWGIIYGGACEPSPTVGRL